MIKTIGKKFEAALEQLLPASQSYEVFAAETGLDDTYVIRVITPAWSKLDKAARIAKVGSAVSSRINDQERDAIFRISVLSPKEWATVRESLVHPKIVKIGGRKKNAVV